MSISSKPRILVVDGEPVVASLCATVLEEAGYDVLCASDSRSAIAAARGQHFDAALLDVALTNGTALDVVSALRAAAPQLGVVGMTAEPAHLVRNRSWVDVHLLKPFRQLDAIGSAITAVRALALQRAVRVPFESA